MAPGSPHHSRETLGGMAQLYFVPIWELAQGLLLLLHQTHPPSCWATSPHGQQNTTQGKGHKSKVKLYFTVIFSIYKELQYMFMGTPSTGLPFSTRSFTYS